MPNALHGAYLGEGVNLFEDHFIKPDFTLPYPNILKYRHIYRAIAIAKNHTGLDAVAASIAAVVPPTHFEFPLLVQAGQERRAELNEFGETGEEHDNS
jgi:hypothetical protein